MLSFGLEALHSLLFVTLELAAARGPRTSLSERIISTYAFAYARDQFLKAYTLCRHSGISKTIEVVPGLLCEVRDTRKNI